MYVYSGYQWICLCVWGSQKRMLSICLCCFEDFPSYVLKYGLSIYLKINVLTWPVGSQDLPVSAYNTWVTGMHSHAQLLHWCWRSELRFPCFHSKSSHPLNYHPSSQINLKSLCSCSERFFIKLNYKRMY